MYENFIIKRFVEIYNKYIYENKKNAFLSRLNITKNKNNSNMSKILYFLSDNHFITCLKYLNNFCALNWL